MIDLYRTGDYKLIETKGNTKILYLDVDAYAWVELAGLGEILVSSHKQHKADCVLSVGKYRILEVQDEPHFSDHLHLELEVGVDYWQGYLLLTGLPDEHRRRVRIIPTNEVITGNKEVETLQQA